MKEGVHQMAVSTPIPHLETAPLTEATDAVGRDRPPQILIVDDSQLMRGMLTALLADAGYREVLTADSGVSAFRTLGLDAGYPGEEVDLVLMDLMLPDTDGIAAIRAIKAHAHLQNVPILMVTASNEEATLAEAFDVGAIDFITKPIKPFDLVARVGSALRLKREIDRREARERDLLEVKRQLEDANQRLAQLSLTDGLTGVANRRHFDQTLLDEWQRATRAQVPLALAMIDIDLFKRYNDTYGHQAGDDCLQRVAAALARCTLRPGDLLARYGGEEFAVILANTDLAGAYSVGERLRSEVATLALAHESSSVSSIVTLSVGIATSLPDAERSSETLIAAADRALYQAKEQGRNQLVAAAAAAAPSTRIG